jgi:hypothetical protein
MTYSLLKEKIPVGSLQAFRMTCGDLSSCSSAGSFVCVQVLEKNYTLVNGQKMITLGDSQIEWKDEFQLYMTTKIANPTYSPEVMGKVSIINYSVTIDGLQQQLLNVVVEYERPDLEKERQTLIQSMSENRQTLKMLEDTLLRELANSKGSILDNEDLINTLRNTKVKAVEIAKALEDGKKTAEEIDKMRQVYQRVAKRGAILYFAMASQVHASYSAPLIFVRHEPTICELLRDIDDIETFDFRRWGCRTSAACTSTPSTPISGSSTALFEMPSPIELWTTGTQAPYT